MTVCWYVADGWEFMRFRWIRVRGTETGMSWSWWLVESWLYLYERIWNVFGFWCFDDSMLVRSRWLWVREILMNKSSCKKHRIGRELVVFRSSPARFRGVTCKRCLYKWSMYAVCWYIMSCWCLDDCMCAGFRWTRVRGTETGMSRVGCI